MSVRGMIMGDMGSLKEELRGALGCFYDTQQQATCVLGKSEQAIDGKLLIEVSD